ncbi:ggdef domain protein [gamma proteobacterium HTCC5015]|nr:ggdef domain protein [gamma proteobacterium HTCC5015]
MDIVGEGGAAIFSLSWIVLILSSRPTGPVTNYLMGGLVLIFASTWQDFLDEVTHLPETLNWGSSLESIAMPLGIIVLTIGLYQWRNEQLAIRQQLLKRERLFRNHHLIDWVTQVGGADYLRRQLSIAMQSAQSHSQPTSLLLLDLDDFAHFNHRYGAREGDRLLHELGELLMLNLRRNDILCRYAGDRYAAILPSTDARSAALVAEQLQLAVAHFAFHLGEQADAYFPRATIGAATLSQMNPTALEERANRSLEWKKRCRDSFNTLQTTEPC